MIRLHVNTIVPKYVKGLWFWDNVKAKPWFMSTYEVARGDLGDDYVTTAGFRFERTMNPLHEMIFRQEFSRPETTKDPDFIQLEDVKNVVLFLAPREFLTEDFIYFLNTKAANNFLRSLVMYFQKYLKCLEFTLIRRDEIKAPSSRKQDYESIRTKKRLSKSLTQYRLLLARSYSVIVYSQDNLKRYYHMNTLIRLSNNVRDKKFHEKLLAFAVQFVWITLHRSYYFEIYAEMNRLFRSDHFSLEREDDKTDYFPTESQLIFGKKFKRTNYRVQVSPVMQELVRVEYDNVPVLWLGEYKYRGPDVRIRRMECEFIMPVHHLYLCNISLGILGHPKYLYDTILELNKKAVRRFKYSVNYDPYDIATQPRLPVPNFSIKVGRKDKTYDPYYGWEEHPRFWTEERMKKWTEREKYKKEFAEEGKIIDIYIKCKKEAAQTEYGPPPQEIIAKFIATKPKRRVVY